MFTPFHINAGSMFGNTPFGFQSEFQGMSVMSSPLAGPIAGPGCFAMLPKTSLDPGGRIQFRIFQVAAPLKVTCIVGGHFVIDVTVSLAAVSGVPLTPPKSFQKTATALDGLGNIGIKFTTDGPSSPSEVALTFRNFNQEANDWNFYDCLIEPA